MANQIKPPYENKIKNTMNFKKNFAAKGSLKVSILLYNL